MTLPIRVSYNGAMFSNLPRLLAAVLLLELLLEVLLEGPGLVPEHLEGELLGERVGHVRDHVIVQPAQDAGLLLVAGGGLL